MDNPSYLRDRAQAMMGERKAYRAVLRKVRAMMDSPVAYAAHTMRPLERWLLDRDRRARRTGGK